MSPYSRYSHFTSSHPTTLNLHTVCALRLTTSLSYLHILHPPTLPQGPLQHTCSHFWKMIWEQKTAGILMLNKCVERGMVSVSLTTQVEN